MAVAVHVVQPRTTPSTVGVADTGVTLLIQVRPVEQAEQAAKTWPFVPTARAVGVLGAVPVIKSPFAVIQAQGMPAAQVIQHKPEAAAEQATRI